MNDVTHLFYGVPIFDGTQWHHHAALEITNGTVNTIQQLQEPPKPNQATHLQGGFLAPGFVDIQVNGGGGVLLNDEPSPETIRIICTAHARFGTTALLPTLISDTEDKQARAILAIQAAQKEGIVGCLGLHLEGPHLDKDKHGAHDRTLIRPMDDKALHTLIDAAKMLSSFLVTLAPEAVTPLQVRKLAQQSITVSLGHSNANYEQAKAYMDAGAKLVTHLFNAMAPLHHRNPGLAGAALNLGTCSASIIGDGHHVDKHMLALALRFKQGPGHIFLVSDAMATAGTELTHFYLNNRKVNRENDCLKLQDGTLAGSASPLVTAVRFIHEHVEIPLEEALRMASLYPAQAIDQHQHHGHLYQGAYANFVHLSDDLQPLATWVMGQKVN